MLMGSVAPPVDVQESSPNACPSGYVFKTLAGLVVMSRCGGGLEAGADARWEGQEVRGEERGEVESVSRPAVRAAKGDGG